MFRGVQRHIFRNTPGFPHTVQFQQCDFRILGQ
jgi:hypothetical protein